MLGSSSGAAELLVQGRLVALVVVRAWRHIEARQLRAWPMSQVVIVAAQVVTTWATSLLPG
jgi:hypothetical protein